MPFPVRIVVPYNLAQFPVGHDEVQIAWELPHVPLGQDFDHLLVGLLLEPLMPRQRGVAPFDDESVLNMTAQNGLKKWEGFGRWVF